MSLASTSSLSLNLESEGSVRTWLETGSGWTSPSAPSLAGSSSQLSLDGQSLPSPRANTDQGKSWQLMSWPSAERKDYGRSGGGGPEGPSAGSLRRDYGRPKEELGSPPMSEGRRPMSSSAAAEESSPSSPSASRELSPLAEEKLWHSSSALSKYVEELRRKRLTDKEPLEEAASSSSLPIYQTAGAPFLRRCRTLKDHGDFPVSLGGLGAEPRVDLVCSSSLRSLSSDCGVRPSLSPVLKGASRFGSYDSLVQNPADPCAKVASPVLGRDVLGLSRPRPWRSCLEPPLEGSLDFGKETLTFQSKRLAEIPREEKDPFSWKIPTPSYERKTNTNLDDFLPAIRKAQSTSSLSRGPKERKDGQRPLSVHFEDQATPPQRTFLSEMKTVLSPQPKAKEEPSHLSDSSDSSSSSVGSFKSADSIKCRPQVPRQEGEGCVGRRSSEAPKVHPRSEAEGREDDVTSIMMKYLGKE
uniref:Uncharacterized protein n=1 Tax=Laticauda laticaudata TaxID=8630 RepID=A0A8C5T500_LATLA